MRALTWQGNRTYGSPTCPGMTSFATHHLPLEQAPHGYAIFRDKADGCLKVVLQP